MASGFPKGHPNYLKSHTPESRAKIGAKSKALWQNEEYRQKMAMRKGRKGLPNPRAREMNWKGDEASYVAKHQWAARHFGKASMCENSPEHKATRYHWASKSGLHLRDRSDWIQLCPRCHWQLDHPNGLTLTAEQKAKISEGLKRAYAEGRR